MLREAKINYAACSCFVLMSFPTMQPVFTGVSLAPHAFGVNERPPPGITPKVFERLLLGTKRSLTDRLAALLIIGRLASHCTKPTLERPSPRPRHRAGRDWRKNPAPSTFAELDNLEFITRPAALPCRLFCRDLLTGRLLERPRVAPEDLGLSVLKIGDDTPEVGERCGGRTDRLDVSVSHDCGQVALLPRHPASIAPMLPPVSRYAHSLSLSSRTGRALQKRPKSHGQAADNFTEPGGNL
jgi:hypothetical protein